ncbi:MAG: hypothetical protein DYH08_11125 [Actinobacteria bacterium ATB1]|nr:hypothetical protein [Actinobacteria bacterium ATB1]
MLGPNGAFRVAGRFPLHDVADLVGVRVDVEDADTVGGAMMALLGRVPDVGDTARDEPSGVTFVAVEVSGHRVETVDLHAPAEEAAGGMYENGRSAS